MKNPLGNLLKQAQEMKAQMAQAKEELGALEVQGEAGGGMVRLTMSGRHEVRRIVIDDALVGEDKEMLEDVLAAAFNDAVGKIDKTVKDKYSGMASGLGLPGDLKLPF